ncbi:MAG: diacylglycerol/lipid kinase family protein [Acidimicrobiia bacterium]
MLRHGEPWGEPTSEAPDLELHGSDADLSAALANLPPGVRIAWTPSATTDLGRAVGRAPGTTPPGATLVPMDRLRVNHDRIGVNAVVLGADPATVRPWHRRVPVTVTVDGRPFFTGRAMSIVVANGEFVRGIPVLPRAHPGDGALDVAVFALPINTRREFRRRIIQGEHLPHPAIRTGRGRTLQVAWVRPRTVVIDGAPAAPEQQVQIELESDSWRLYV